MRRAVFLDSDNSTEDASVHNFKFPNRREQDFKEFIVKSCNVQYNPTVSTAVTAADIAALQSYVWIDLEDKTKISPANITTGTSVTSVVSKGTAPIVTYASANGLLYDTLLNSSMACVTSTISWHSMYDGTQPNLGQGLEGTFTFVFQTPATISGYHWLAKNRVFRIQASTVLRIVEDTTVHSTNIALAVSTPYICQCIWDNSTKDMICEVINLLDNVSQTQTINMPNNLPGTPNYNFYFPGNAQTGFIHYKVAGCIELQTKSAPAALTCVNYYKQLYSGVAQQTTSTIPTSLLLCSTYLTDRRTGKSLVHNKAVELLAYQGMLNSEPYYALQHEGLRWPVDKSTLLRDIDIYFTRPDGVVIGVTHFALALDLLDDLSQL